MLPVAEVDMKKGDIIRDKEHGDLYKVDSVINGYVSFHSIRGKSSTRFNGWDIRIVEKFYEVVDEE